MVVLSIFTTLFCNLPLGVIALYLAATAGSAQTREAAESRLKNAKLINYISIALVLFTIIGIIIIFGLIPFLIMIPFLTL
ncbi:MAG: hypothetical protein GX362_02970 [Methanosarcinaceae archaeon]|nr:hypothetical protein [Methanosarcinaceae archaeon]